MQHITDRQMRAALSPQHTPMAIYLLFQSYMYFANRNQTNTTQFLKYPGFGQGDDFRDSPPERTRSHRGQLWEVLLFCQVCSSSTELVPQSNSCINKNKPQKSIPEEKIAVRCKFRFPVLSEPLHDT